MGSEKFCLKWNDFESNISSAFRELRNDGELFDVTLATADEEHLPAHKVILAGCSGFFRNIFKRSGSHQSLLFYLKGVSSREMTSILTFMYNGEVSVAQGDLNNFLQVAEDLRVKGKFEKASMKLLIIFFLSGLTQNNSRNSDGPSETLKQSSHNSLNQRPKNFLPRRPKPPTPAQSYQSHLEDEIQEVAQISVKSEVPVMQSEAEGGSEEVGGTVAEYGDGDETYLEGNYWDSEYGDYTEGAGQDQGLAGDNKNVL